MTTKKKIYLGIIIICLIGLLILLLCINKNTFIEYEPIDRKESISQLYTLKELNIYKEENTKSKVVGNIEENSWVNIESSNIKNGTIWYKLLIDNKEYYIKGVDNYEKYVEEYIPIVENKNVVNVFYDIDDDISDLETYLNDNHKEVTLVKYNVYFKENYKLFYKFKHSENKENIVLPVVTAGSGIFEKYIFAYDSILNEYLNNSASNILSDLKEIDVSKKTCNKEKIEYLDEEEYLKIRKQYEVTRGELENSVAKAEELIEETGGLLTDEMYKKIADMTKDESELETVKQRYILADTYKGFKSELKNTKKNLEYLDRKYNTRLEISKAVFPC